MKKNIRDMEDRANMYVIKIPQKRKQNIRKSKNKKKNK